MSHPGTVKLKGERAFPARWRPQRLRVPEAPVYRAGWCTTDLDGCPSKLYTPACQPEAETGGHSDKEMHYVGTVDPDRDAPRPLG